MSTPLSPTRLFICTACGATLPVGEEHLGKRCRCGRCGHVSVVSEDTPHRERPEPEPPPSTQYVGFHCRVCDTYMSAHVKYVGRKAKCPDCGALNKIPSPLTPVLPQKPRALQGQQYGLWGVDEAPSGAELAARQPKLFPVYCRVCDTLMHARPQHVGKNLLCPDCGAKTVIPPPPPLEEVESPLVPDGQEYQLDATQTLPVRPQPQFVQTVPAGETSKKEPIREERKERPRPPLLPTLWGVSPMLRRSPIFGLWLWLTTMGAIVAWLTSNAIGPVTSAIEALFMIACYAMAFLTGLLWLASASATWLAILTESSEGNDRLQQPPGVNFFDWFGDVFYLASASMVAMAPWWLICRLTDDQLTVVQQGILQGCGWLFTFPLLLLSCLENGSPLEPFSLRIMGSVSRRPGYWLLLVIESIALMGGFVLAIAGLLTTDVRLGWLIIPLGVAVSMLYFRILGRFAWWLAESLPEEDD